jgi:hypothetical protein
MHEDTAMTIESSRSTPLRRGSLLRIQARPGGSVRCIRGLVWLTQQNDPNDRVLSAGEAFSFDRTGMALVNALGSDAAVAISEGLDHAPARPSAHRVAPLSLSGEIARLCPRIDRNGLVQLPPGTRNAVVEREARRMRAQVLWLLVQQIRRSAAEWLAMASAFARRAHSQARRQPARRGIAETRQGI